MPETPQQPSLVLGAISRRMAGESLSLYDLTYYNPQNGNAAICEIASETKAAEPSALTADTLGKKASYVTLMVFDFDNRHILVCEEHCLSVNRRLTTLPRFQLPYPVLDFQPKNMEAYCYDALNKACGLKISRIDKALPMAYTAPDITDTAEVIAICHAEGTPSDQPSSKQNILYKWISRNGAGRLVSNTAAALSVTAQTLLYAWSSGWTPITD